MKYEPQYKNNSKAQPVTEFQGKLLRAGASHFTIAGRRILVKGTRVKYYETNGDPDTNYIAFRFLEQREDGRWRPVDPIYMVTEAAFVRKAGVWEPPVEVKYVTIGQLMEKNGAPCEAGCRALYGFMRKDPRAGNGKSRDELIIAITKLGMMHGAWNGTMPVQDLYDWHVKNIGAVPFDYLNYIAQTIGVQVIGGVHAATHGRHTKSYELLCRALGIKP